MKTRVPSASRRCVSSALSPVLHGQTSMNSEPHLSGGARCLFEVFLQLPHDVPSVRQHLHDSVVNFCPADCPQSVRIDLEQKPHGTRYRIRACLSDAGQFIAANHELTRTIEKFAGGSVSRLTVLCD